MQPRNIRPPLAILAVLWVIGSLIVGLIVFIILARPESQPVVGGPGLDQTPTALAVGSVIPPLGTGINATPTAVPITSPVSETQSPAGAATASKPTKTPTIAPIQDTRFGYGGQVNGLISDPDFAMTVVNQLGLEWVKQQVRWADFAPARGQINWDALDPVVKQANKHRLKLMLSIVTAPAWSRKAGDTNGPPDNFNDYADFVGQLVQRYPGRVHAIEVWNEQNISREWNTGQLSAARYTALLKVTYSAIKSRDPNLIVISGALSPTGLDDGVNAIDDFKYLQQLVSAGFLSYADCVGAHHNGYNIGPDVAYDAAPRDPQAASATFRGPFDNPHHSWSFKSTLQTYNQILKGAKKLCVTEFGWASSEGLGGFPPGFEFANDNTLQEQADWVVQAFNLMREWGFVWIGFLWNIDYGPKGNGPTDNNVPYSITDMRGVPRPAFDAVQKMPKPDH